MDEQQPPGGISLEDWQATPEAVRRLVMALLATVEQLQQEVARLRERVHQTSQNSSKPPSSDPPSVKRKPPVKKGQRQRDGQPGHRGKGRQLQPPQEVSRFVISRRQVTALPRMAPHPPTMPPSVPCAGRSSGGGAASARKVRLAVALGNGFKQPSLPCGNNIGMFSIF